MNVIITEQESQKDNADSADGKDADGDGSDSNFYSGLTMKWALPEHEDRNQKLVNTKRKAGGR